MNTKTEEYYSKEGMVDMYNSFDPEGTLNEWGFNGKNAFSQFEGWCRDHGIFSNKTTLKTDYQLKAWGFNSTKQFLRYCYDNELLQKMKE